MSTDQSPAAPAPATPEPPADSGLGRPIPQSADPIDRVVRLAPPWTVFVLVACGLLVAAGLVWAFTGRIVQVVSSEGILQDNGFVVVSATADGQVTDITVDIGDAVTAGQILAVVDDSVQLTAPRDGNVSTVYQAEGAALLTGDAVVSITDYAASDSVFALVSPSLVGTVLPGQSVRVELSSAPAATYGYVIGTVESISGAPLTTEEVASRLGIKPQVVASELGDEPGLLVSVALSADAETPSGYAWTVGEGPSFVPVQGTGATANIVLSEMKPVEVLFGGSS
jgi:hypothetical protein